MNQSLNVVNNTLPDRLFPFIWRYLRNRKLYLTGFFCIALIWAINMTLSPYLLKVIIDSSIQYSQNTSVMLVSILIPAILYVSMSIIINLTFRLHDYLNLRLYPEIKSSIGKDMYAFLLQHSYAFFQNNFAGSLTRKINDMATSVDAIITIIKVAVIPRVLALIISSVTLFTVVSPIFGFILFVWTILFVFIIYVVTKGSENLAREFSEAATRMDGVMSDAISNIMSIKLFANMHVEISYLSKYIDALVACDRKLLWKNLKSNFIGSCCITTLIGAMLAALIYGRVHGTVTPGDFAFVLMLSLSFIMSIEDIRQQQLEFTRLVGRCNQALSFIRLPHELPDAADATAISVNKGVIHFNNVSYHYENNKLLFENLNITINSGENVGLVGYSGGGKSTFIKLILRLIDPQSGRVLVDDQDVKQVTKSSLRKQIGTIPQEPDLFHRSIMENIRFAKPEASDDEVFEAAKRARCHEFISELPDQYETLVGERGIKLSGGQKQRVAIARAFLKNAPILLMDEATSSLDSITERYIQDSIHDVMIDKTTIVIAHRLSTLKNMDRILVFVSGKIVEDGSLESLLANKNSHFYKLWQMQAEGFIPSISVNGSHE